MRAAIVWDRPLHVPPSSSMAGETENHGDGHRQERRKINDQWQQGGSNTGLHKPGFTDEQWQTLLKLMENCKTTPIEEKLSGMKIHNEWILDSGASYHMTGNDGKLRRMTKIDPVVVTLPNGVIWMNARLTLNDVLLVHGLQCNLISLAQLIDKRKCDIFFTNDLCVIHDLLTRMPIGVGDRRGGVYYFRSRDRAQVHAVAGMA
ncbi:unnamed protein product [Cuscuta europaea]|uniref:Uncharacterized protein n=1 Tax=Cuscuta europaea TaxID=41803 RepID=A0A9P0ZXM1_CUSEU|nr:unnamed protein product [Cuscuta europaea]